MMCKPVKELSVYPELFGGKVNENVYRFKQNMIEAMEGNQIAEKVKKVCFQKIQNIWPNVAARSLREKDLEQLGVAG